MEPLGCRPQSQNRHVRRQHRVQRSLQLGQAVLPVRLETDDLSFGVNPSICAPGTDDPCVAAHQAGQGPLQFSLDRPLARLDLKAEKVGAIVLDPGPQARGGD